MKGNLRLISLACLIMFLGALACNEQPKELNLMFDPLGNVSMIGKDSHLAVKIGPMHSSVTAYINSKDKPPRNVTRLIVRDSRFLKDKSDSVFDISYFGSIEIRGDGQYRINKQANTNIWLLELDGSKVNTLQIIQGQPENTVDYKGIGLIIIIFGVILLIIGFVSLPLGVPGCLILIIGFVLTLVGFVLRSGA